MFLYIQIKKENQKGSLNLIVFIIKILKMALIARKTGWGVSPLSSVTMRIVPALVLTPNYLHSSFSPIFLLFSCICELVQEC